jgi:hypothetical protein
MPIYTPAFRAAQDAFLEKPYRPRTPIQNPQTPGQTATGQSTGMAPKPLDKAGALSPNTQGFATGAGAADIAREKMQQAGAAVAPVAASGAGSVAAAMAGGAAPAQGVLGGPGGPERKIPMAQLPTQPSTTKTLGEEQGRGSLPAGGAQEAEKPDGKASFQQVEGVTGEDSRRGTVPGEGISDAEYEALQNAALRSRWIENSLGRTPGEAAQTAGENIVDWKHDPYDAEVSKGRVDRKVAEAAQDEWEKTLEGKTAGEQALWSELMKDKETMSAAERKALEAAAKESLNAAMERANRAQGAAGGESALQAVMEGAANYNYGQAMGDIEKQAYDRRMQEINQAMRLEEGAAARGERESKAFDDASAYFKERGYIIGADGSLYQVNEDGTLGQSVSPNQLSAEDRSRWEQFQYEMAMEVPGQDQKGATGDENRNPVTGEPYGDSYLGYNKPSQTQDELKREQRYRALRDGGMSPADARKKVDEEFGKPNTSGGEGKPTGGASKEADTSPTGQQNTDAAIRELRKLGII